MRPSPKVASPLQRMPATLHGIMRGTLVLALLLPSGAAAQDRDGDGIPDAVELRGFDFNQDGVIDVDFPAMGANPNRKDIFIEVDFMLQDFNGDGDTNDPGEHSHRPMPGAVQALIDAFARAPVRNPDGSFGITVHVDTGQFGGGNAIPHFYELDFSGTTNGDRRTPALAASAGPMFLVWEDDRDENGSTEILAQRLTAGGILSGNEFVVNPVSSGNQRRPAVAMNAAGTSVVVWEDDQDDNGFYEIHAAAFGPFGRTPMFMLGSGNPVNSVSSGQQRTPVVAIDAAGNFVVTWEDDQDGNGFYQIHARGFDAAGAPRFSLEAGNPVNTVDDGQQRNPAIAMNSAGNFVVAWQDDQDGNGYYQILARGFDINGNARFTREDAQPINSVASGQQYSPAVAMDDANNFVVAWEDDRDGNGYYQIHARGFDGGGNPRFSLEDANPVNSVAFGQQRDPSVAADLANGAFTVAWEDDQDDNGYYQILARGFNGDGTQRFADLTVNTVATGQQRNASVAMFGSSVAVVVWDDDRRASGHQEVFVREFDAAGAQTFVEALGHGRGTNATFATMKAQHFSPARVGFFHYCLFVHNRINTGSSGFARYLDDDLIVSLGSLANQVGSQSQQANTLMHELGHNLNLRHGGNETTNNKPNYNSVMNYDFQFLGIDTTCDAQGDGVLDYSVGVRTTLDEDRLDEPLGVCDGTVAVNSEASGQQLAPRVGMSDTGAFVVTWQDDQDDNGYYQILARAFNAAGMPIFAFEEPNAVNRVSDGQQIRPAIDVGPNGEFVIAWQDDADENGYWEILARGFDANGNARFAREQPTPANSVSGGQQVAPGVAVDATGRSVVVWQDDQDGNGYWEIHARAFGATGAPRFSLEAGNPVNSVSSGQQIAPSVAMSGTGSFVVAWEDDQDGNGWYQILARGFNANGAQIFSLQEPTAVNVVATGQQRSPAVAMNSAGAFVVAWIDDQDKNGYWEIHARAFDADGTQRFSRQEPTQVNTISSGQQIAPAVAIDTAGNVIVVWQDDQDENGYWEILARGFDPAGAQRFGLEAESPVNAISSGQQVAPAVAIASNGNFVVAWQDDLDGNGYYQILARVLGPLGTPINALAIDWNGDGNLQDDVAFDVNGDDSRGKLKDFDDWEHIRLDF